MRRGAPQGDMPAGVDCELAAHVNPHIFELEKKPKAILCHEIGAGSRCLKCDCPGLDLHFWRKICKVCSCRMDDHDVVLPEEMDHGKIIIGRLFDIIPAFEQKLRLSPTLASHPASSAASGKLASANAAPLYSVPHKKAVPDSQFNVRMEQGVEQDQVVTEYTWIPTGDRTLVEKYFDALPAAERPIAGTQGAIDRRQKLQYQLPHHDSDISAAKSIVTDADREQHARFIKTIKEKVIGIGQLIEWNDAAKSDESRSASGSFVEDGGGDQRRTPLGNASRLTVGSGLPDSAADFGRCRLCGKQMKAGEVGIVTDHGPSNEVWHPNCFRCHTCDQRIIDLLYFYKDGEYYCGRHFGDSTYPRCAGCDELIFSKEYTFAEEKNWHYDHFCCFGCDLQLGGHRYMMRDGQPFCFNCYMAKFARTCQTCHNKIAPDQQRISFKELHWHAEDHCFHCKNCRKVLLSQKFIIKNEEVFCSSDCKKEFFN